MKSKIMGYEAGSTDLMIVTEKRTIFVELKTPTGMGKISPNQYLVQEKLRSIGKRVLVSNDYDEMIDFIGGNT